MSTEAAMTAGNRTSAAYYEKEYIPGIYKWGMITNTLGIILAFLPAMVISVVFGITPSFSMIVAGSTLQLMSGTLVSWLVDPIAMYPMLGMPGMFMSFLSGNISNLRLPALAAAQQLAATIKDKTVVIKSKGNGGRLFGKITSKEVAQHLSQMVGTEIDKRKVELERDIKEFGTTNATVKLHPGVTSTFKVKVEEQ